MDLANERIRLSSGLTLRTHHRGGTGTPVVCMHGIWDEGSYFNALAGEGPGTFAGHPMYLVDLRGHGESDKPESGYSWMDYADDIVSLVEDEGFDQSGT